MEVFSVLEVDNFGFREIRVESTNRNHNNRIFKKFVEFFGFISDLNIKWQSLVVRGPYFISLFISYSIVRQEKMLLLSVTALT